MEETEVRELLCICRAGCETCRATQTPSGQVLRPCLKNELRQLLFLQLWIKPTSFSVACAVGRKTKAYNDLVEARPALLREVPMHGFVFRICSRDRYQILASHWRKTIVASLAESKPLSALGWSSGKTRSLRSSRGPSTSADVSIEGLARSAVFQARPRDRRPATGVL